MHGSYMCRVAPSRARRLLCCVLHLWTGEDVKGRRRGGGGRGGAAADGLALDTFGMF